MPLLANLEKVYFSEAPTLGTVTEAYGIDASIFWIKTQILSIDFYAGQKKEGDINAINELAKNIAYKHTGVKVTEFELFVALFKSGEYGFFFGSFDPIFLGAAFKKYQTTTRQIHLDKLEREKNQREIEARRFIPPEGYSSLSWYQELKKRANDGDKEAINILNNK